jgi:hypothetical protein
MQNKLCFCSMTVLDFHVFIVHNLIFIHFVEFIYLY